MHCKVRPDLGGPGPSSPDLFSLFLHVGRIVAARTLEAHVVSFFTTPNNGNHGARAAIHFSLIKNELREAEKAARSVFEAVPCRRREGKTTRGPLMLANAS